jgi:putative lipoprotein
MIHLKVLLPAALLAMTAAACATVPPKAGPLPSGLDGTSWRAVTVTGLPVLEGAASTLSFTGDGIGGQAACNRYRGPLVERDGRLRVGPLAATRMACAPEVMEQERRFLTALEQGERLERDGSALLLRSTGRAEPTRFLPIAADTPS